MISIDLAGSLGKTLDSDLLFISLVFQLSSDVNCHPVLQ